MGVEQRYKVEHSMVGGQTVFDAENGARVQLQNGNSDGPVHSILPADALHEAMSSFKGNNGYGKQPEYNLGQEHGGKKLAQKVDRALDAGDPMAEIAELTGFGTEGDETEGWVLSEDSSRVETLTPKVIPDEGDMIEAQEILLERSTEPTADLQHKVAQLVDLHTDMEARTQGRVLTLGTPSIGTPDHMGVTSRGKYGVYIEKMLLINGKKYIADKPDDLDAHVAWEKLAHAHGFPSFAAFRACLKAGIFPYGASHKSFGVPTNSDGAPLSLTIAYADFSNSAMGTPISELMCATNPLVFGHDLGVRDARTLLRRSNIAAGDSKHIYTKEEYARRISRGVLSGSVATMGRVGYCSRNAQNGDVIPSMYGKQRIRLESPSKSTVRSARVEQTGTSSSDLISVVCSGGHFATTSIAANHAIAQGANHPVQFYSYTSLRDPRGNEVTHAFNTGQQTRQLETAIRDAQHLHGFIEHTLGHNDDVYLRVRLAQIGLNRALSGVPVGVRDLADLAHNPISGNPADVTRKMIERGVSADEIAAQQLYYQEAAKAYMPTLLSIASDRQVDLMEVQKL